MSLQYRGHVAIVRAKHVRTCYMFPTGTIDSDTLKFTEIPYHKRYLIKQIAITIKCDSPCKTITWECMLVTYFQQALQTITR